MIESKQVCRLSENISDANCLLLVFVPCSVFVKASAEDPADAQLCEAMLNFSLKETSIFQPESQSSNSSSGEADDDWKGKTKMTARRSRLNDFFALLWRGRSWAIQETMEGSQYANQKRPRYQGTNVGRGRPQCDHTRGCWLCLGGTQRLWYGREGTGTHSWGLRGEEVPEGPCWNISQRTELGDTQANPIHHGGFDHFQEHAELHTRPHWIQVKDGETAWAPMGSWIGNMLQKKSKVASESDTLDHFLVFITSPHVVQDLPYGQRYLRLSSGEILETPNVIRTMVPSRLVRQYQAYCDETGFSPFGEATMLRILSACSATVRTSLQGLDYIAADGAKGFDDLCNVVKCLEEKSVASPMANWKTSLTECIQYLKSDYKVMLRLEKLHQLLLPLHYYLPRLNANIQSSFIIKIDQHRPLLISPRFTYPTALQSLITAAPMPSMTPRKVLLKQHAPMRMIRDAPRVKTSVTSSVTSRVTCSNQSLVPRNGKNTCTCADRLPKL